jgi:hypothetical protein
MKTKAKKGAQLAQLTVLFALTLGLGACGGSDDAPAATPPSVGAPPASPAPPAAGTPGPPAAGTPAPPAAGTPAPPAAGTPAPPPATPAPPAPAPASDVFNAANYLACPASENLISTNQWMACFAGKRLVGQDTLNPAVGCELRFLANSRLELVHNGVTYPSAPVANWSGGLYQNTSLGDGRLMLGSVRHNGNAGAANRISDLDLSLARYPSQPNNPSLNAKSIAVKIQTSNDSAISNLTINCKIDNF